jgi:hypothetical protein
MALDGTLRDFSLADILQLIGLQKKTGTLLLKGKDDTVTVSFEDGRVVAAESEVRRFEDRLGHVLVKSGRVDGTHLARVLQRQRESGQRIGDILLVDGSITQDELRQALQLQLTQILYRLFRWSEGEFRFTQSASVDFDRKNCEPIPVENILMEGVRILDEWPLIERKVGSFRGVYASTDSGRIVRCEEGDDLDLSSTHAAQERETGGHEVVSLPPAQAVVYNLLDGTRTVQDVIDASNLGEFETCKALFELLESDLIEKVQVTTEEQAAPDRSGARDRTCAAALAGVATLLFVVTGITAWMFPALAYPRHLAGIGDQARLTSSQTRLARLDYAIRVHALALGKHPEALSELVVRGLVEPSALRDPWGERFQYILTQRSYQVRGLDGSGAERPELVVGGPTLQENASEEPTALLDPP